MDNTTFAETIGTDRLQKAIERNRRKQELRGLRSSSSSLSSNSFENPPMGNMRSKMDTIEVGASSRSWTPPSSARPRRAMPTTKNEMNFSEIGPSSRKTVATGEQLEFSTALRASPSRAPARPTYTSAKRKVKTKKSHERFTNIMLKSAWAFCGFLLLRLIFSGGGILDFNERRAMLEGREHELETIKLDNQKTIAEIELIQKDVSTQKKLVRDHLGFIARDEYLIIFQKDNSKAGESFSIEGGSLSANL